jgi:hypothetical protein
MTLVGMAAKRKGASKNWRQTQTLWWQGEKLDRHSQEYADLLDEAYLAMFTQNEGARRALIATGDAVLQHSIGKSNARDTVLTRSEFCSRLMRIRAELERLPKKGGLR